MKATPQFWPREAGVSAFWPSAGGSDQIPLPRNPREEKITSKQAGNSTNVGSIYGEDPNEKIFRQTRRVGARYV